MKTDIANSDKRSPIAEEVSLQAFANRVLTEGKLHYRDLPWRYLDDSYAVLVSEVMLQQTQVSRVLGKWSNFLKLFPTIDALAAADTALILETWQGLGYNRRALALKKCADLCATDYGGTLPKTYDELIKLPGIGPATAAGVMAFAYDKPTLYLETNVRTVFIYEFFPNQQTVSDKEIIPLIEATCPTADVRTWYYALLDYGAYLKSTVGNHSQRSTTYTKQSKFEGSRRQKRAALLRIVLSNPNISRNSAFEALAEEEQKNHRPEPDPAEINALIDNLITEGFFAETSLGLHA